MVVWGWKKKENNGIKLYFFNDGLGLSSQLLILYGLKDTCLCLAFHHHICCQVDNTRNQPRGRWTRTSLREAQRNRWERERAIVYLMEIGMKEKWCARVRWWWRRQLASAVRACGCGEDREWEGREESVFFENRQESVLIVYVRAVLFELRLNLTMYWLCLWEPALLFEFRPNFIAEAWIDQCLSPPPPPKWSNYLLAPRCHL
jgi:hypothetical protein